MLCFLEHVPEECFVGKLYYIKQINIDQVNHLSFFFTLSQNCLSCKYMNI